MQYHAAFVFNMIDIAPISGRNVLLTIVLLLSAAIVNAQIFGIFFGHIEDLKQPEKNLSESLDMVRNSNFRLGLPSELSEDNISQVLRTNQYKTLQTEINQFLKLISSTQRTKVHTTLI